MKLILQKKKMQNFLALGAPPAARDFVPKPPASGGWGLRPQTPKTAPHCEFLATRLQGSHICRIVVGQRCNCT